MEITAVVIFCWQKKLNPIKTVSTITDTAIQDCECMQL